MAQAAIGLFDSLNNKTETLFRVTLPMEQSPKRKIDRTRVVILVAVALIALAAGLFYLKPAPAKVSITAVNLQMNYASGQGSYFGPSTSSLYSASTTAGGQLIISITITNEDASNGHSIEGLELTSDSFSRFALVSSSPDIQSQFCSSPLPNSAECPPYLISPGGSVTFTLTLTADCSATSFGVCVGPSYAGPLNLYLTTHQ
jgi:hypothetical protein